MNVLQSKDQTEEGERSKQKFYQEALKAEFHLIHNQKVQVRSGCREECFLAGYQQPPVTFNE